jgi:uncharacterized protein
MTPPPTLRELSAVRIALRDGIELVGDFFVGDGAQPAPAILELTPYGRGRDRQNFSGEAAYWVRHGYAFVIVDCRGTGDSQGDYRFAVGDGGDGDDGYDLVEWIARQPWCNGRVGMRGASYTGTNQWQVARKRPPSLKAIVPNATGYGRDDVVYDGGIFHFNWAMTWPINVPGSGLSLTAPPNWAAGIGHRPLRSADEAVLGQPSRLYRHFLDHPPNDHAYWAASHYSAEDYAGMQVPVLAFSGWFDGTLRGTLAHDVGMRAASHHPVHLIVGPWEHSSCSDGGSHYLDGKPIDRVGEAVLPPQAFLPGLAITRAFYDAHLKGEGSFEQPPLQLYLTGSERWISADTWPPAAAQPRPMYLHSAGHANGLHGDGALASTRTATTRRTRHSIRCPICPALHPGCRTTWSTWRRCWTDTTCWCTAARRWPSRSRCWAMWCWCCTSAAMRPTPTSSVGSRTLRPTAARGAWARARARRCRCAGARASSARCCYRRARWQR